MTLSKSGMDTSQGVLELFLREIKILNHNSVYGTETLLKANKPLNLILQTTD